MLTLLIIIAVIIFVAGLLLALKRFDRVRQKYGDVVAYALPTIFGVALTLISIYLPIKIEAQRTKEDQIKLLTNGLEDVYQTRQSVIGQLAILIQTAEREYQIGAAIGQNGLPKPRILFRLLGNEKVVLSMNTEMLESVRMLESNVLNLADGFHVDSLRNQQAAENVGAYCWALWSGEEILRLCISSLQESWSDSVFDHRKQLQLGKANSLRNQHGFLGREVPWMELGK